MSKNLIDQAILYLLSESEIGTNSSGKRFYGYFLSSMRKHYDNTKVETAGINVTSQVNLYINTDFFKTLTIPQRVEVLEHEIKHLISNHHSRFKKLDSKDQKLWNIACDAAINEPLTHLHEMGVTVDKLKKTIKDLKKGETPEYYYKALKNYRDENGGKDGKGQDELEKKYGQNGSDGKVIDEHDKWSENSEEAGEGSINSQELQNEILKKSMKDAIDKVGGRGNVPMDIIKALEALNSATINWQKELRRFYQKVDKFTKETTRKKLNRRYRHLNPGRRKKPMTHIAIAVDESGSVSDSLHKQFFSEIEAASKIDNIKFTIIHADCTINRVYEYKPGMKIERTGMGGTSYMPAIDKATELKVDGMIYFGDGDIFGEKLTKPRFPFLWAMEDGRDAPAQWGRVCHVKLEEKR
jgi:predicted metal-dependent peptidase